jgi:hypothetical protein
VGCDPPAEEHRRLWLLQECRRQWMLEGLVQRRSRRDGCCGPSFTAVINPTLSSSREMPRKIAAIAAQPGRSADPTPANTSRHTESLALRYRQVLKT